MSTKVKSLTSFIHGRVVLQPGEEGTFTKGDAEELQKSGLVEIIGDAPVEAKMDEPVQNKMEPAVSNKSVKVKP